MPRTPVLAGLAFLTAALTVHASSFQVPPPPQAAQPGHGIILGRVVDASSGAAVANAVVSLTGGGQMVTTVATGEVIVSAPVTSPGPSAPRQVMTDAEGRFMFRDLPRGRHNLRVTAAGYVAGGYGQNRAGGSQQTIELTSDSERLSGITVRIWKVAAISGTVTDEAGEPVIRQSVRLVRKMRAGARVRLTPSTMVTTDDRGFYRFGGLAPGDYLVAILSSTSTLPVTIVEAYQQEMAAGGAADFAKRPLYRSLMDSEAPPPSGAGHRVDDLILQTTMSMSRLGIAVPQPTDDGVVAVYPTTFYPNARTADQATVITLASGEERRGVDLQLRLLRSVRVSGTLVGPDGPAGAIGVRLVPKGVEEFSTESGLETAATATSPTGEFTFLGVTPGDYILKVVKTPRPVFTEMTGIRTEVVGPGGMVVGMVSGGDRPMPELPTEPTLWASLPVSVGETAVRGLNVTLRVGPRVSGRIEFDGTLPRPAPAQLQRTVISFTPIEARQSLSTSQVRIEPDGRFVTPGLTPGRYQLTASIVPLAGGVTGWTFKSATVGARNVSDELLDIGGEDVTGLVITFTDKTTELSGLVINAKGQPDATAEVVAFPADSMGWKQGTVSRRVRTVRTSSTGNYVINGLSAGEYYVAAIAGELVTDALDPKFLESVMRVATRIALAEGDKKTQPLSTKSFR